MKNSAAQSFNTKDSTAELCLFYNMALDRINDVISTYENNEIAIETIEDWDNFKGFKDSTYYHLQAYLWKEKVSQNYAIVRDNEKKLIHLFLQKLVDIRNFQSHYYHDSTVLKFPEILIDFIYNIFFKIKNELEFQNPNFSEHFETLKEDIKEFTKDNNVKTDIYYHFDYFDKNGFIKEEGKNFFLSFFLLKGEMNKFLKKRNRCKKDNGEKYQVKTKLLTYLCHRDGSNRFFLDGKKDFLDNEELVRRQNNTILNYLKSKPIADKKYLPAKKEMKLFSKIEMEERKEKRIEHKQSEETKFYPRRKNKFLEIAVRYFMDRTKLLNTDNQSIYWHIKKLDWNTIEKQSIENSNGKQKTYGKSFKDYSSQYVLGEFPVFMNNHIKFKLNKNDKEYAISAREIKNWLYFLLMQKRSMNQCIELLKNYGIQYMDAMTQLVAENNITFENYPLVFLDENNQVNKSILSEMYLSILENKPFDQNSYKADIKKAIAKKIKRINAMLTEDVYSSFTRNKKNRIIIDNFNWFLPLDAKLKPEEINKLSIYNFVAENTTLSKKSRNSIIADISYKLEKSKNQAFSIIQSANSLQELYINMLLKLKESIQNEFENVDNYNLDQLHELASKLNVKLTGITISRTSKNRETELKEYLLNKPILVTNGLFKRYFMKDSKNSISALIRKNDKWTSLLMTGYYDLISQNEFINLQENAVKDISQNVLEIVNQKFDTYFNEHTSSNNEKYSDLIARFEKHFEKSEATTREILKAVKLFKRLRELQTEDAILAQIFFEYHFAKTPLSERETKQVKLETLFEEEFVLTDKNNKAILVQGKPFTLKYKQLDDLATYWDRNKIVKLINNISYWNDSELNRLDEKTKKSHQQKILIILNKLWLDSFDYIDGFLAFEKKVISSQDLEELLEESKKIINTKNGKQYLRIEPLVLLRKLKTITDNEINMFSKLRNSAFHTDVPENNMKYSEQAEILRNKADIKKQPRKFNHNKK